MYRLLHLVPYSNFVPAQNGGALRCYHLSVELSKYFDVTVLTMQPKSTLNDDGFVNIEVINPSRTIKFNGLRQKINNAIKYRLYKRTYRGPAQATVLQFYPVLKALSKTTSFDYVLMEHLDSIELGASIKRLFPKAMRIADQHNVDHLLFKQYNNLEIAKNKKEFNYLKRQESELHLNADYFFACSKEDTDTLEKLNHNKIPGFVVPNGTTLKSLHNIKKNSSKARLIFCGALDTEPNKNGLLWFYNHVWPELKQSIKEITLTIVGRNGHAKAYNALKNDTHINFVGEVDDVAPYYQQKDLAVVPLLEGSGTRLKILEAMSFGVPVVSTTIGAEGITYKDGYDILIADTKRDFVEAIKTTISQPERLQQMSKQGLLLVEKKYYWTNIGSEVANILNGLL